ncbi:MAG TPA: cystathionine beta-lyase [Alphaproteobacteria bacterium]|nr:cystathionine beta-lyase [Alphaproteobacteria bacterium]HAJ46972.1 cystathionine beta-lyase [Alphaproteobacteria bacterium]
MSKAGKDTSYGSRTTVVIAGRDPKGHAGAVNIPPYRASTILHDSVRALTADKPRFTYGRRGTPTTAAMEEMLSSLHGAEATVLTPSGLSACTLALLTALEAGGELLITDSAYEPTRHFAMKLAKRFGITAIPYDPLAGAEVARLFTPRTRAILVESPGSLTFEVQDLPAIAGAARAQGICVVADNTWATPLLCQPLGLGADMVIESCTKYVVGHSDANLGAVSASADWAERLRATHYHLGLTAGADDVYLALRGIRTMAVRLKAAEEGARTLIAWLKTRPEAGRILYPGDESDPGHALWRRDFRGASGLFGLGLAPMSKEALSAMLDGLALFGMGYSWGGYESLIIPADPHRSVRPYAGPGPLLRISVGLEDPQDLIADLAAGFDRARAAA